MENDVTFQQEVEEMEQWVGMEDDVDDNGDLMRQAERVAELLSKEKLALAVAESCTAGVVSYVLTSVPDSSRWFDRGFVAYNEKSKVDMLGLSEELIATHGAVSEQVVLEMAKNACLNSDADLSAAVTGIAGPSGGTEDVPVGTVWFAWHRRKDDYSITEVHKFDGDRKQVRLAACSASIRGIEKLL